VPLAAINSANVVTLFTEDGKVVHRMIYQVRNSAKQFLHIQLPPKADVWSVFVDNQPVESSLNQTGTLLIPLIRSKTVGETLQTFPVEVIIAFSKSRFSWMGSKGNTLPAVDLMISQLIWSVYLPNGYAFNYFTSTLEKEKIIRGVNLFSGARRRYDQSAMNKLSERMDTAAPQAEVDELSKAYKGKAAQSSFKNVPMEEKEMASQMAVEMGFSGRMEGMAQQAAPMSPGSGTGLLPITIQIPTSGQLYRFARTIIKPEDPLKFNVYYTQLWLVESIKSLFVILLIFIVFIIIKKDMGPWRWLKKQSQHLKSSYSKHESTLKGFAQSKLTLVLLFILIVAFWGISGFITLIFILLFLAGILYQLKIFIKDKRKGGDDDIILAESEKPQPRQNQNGDNEDC
jgi:hypothetical protein